MPPGAACARSRDTVASMLDGGAAGRDHAARLETFRREVMLSKLRLLSMLRELKEAGARICGISAPSRASTLVNYVGLDAAIIDYVCEIAGSLKIGKYMPGTLDPGGRGKPAVHRSARLCDSLLLAHRRRARAQASRQGISRQAAVAPAGPARAVIASAGRSQDEASGGEEWKAWWIF